MAITYGFYNSVNGDRKYNANQMNTIFDGIISDGIFHKIGSRFEVTSDEGFKVHVGTGRAWFNHTWTYNDSIFALTLDSPDLTLKRIDTIIIEVDTSDEVRANTIKVLKGDYASTPVRKTLIKSPKKNQYALATILVTNNASRITNANITNLVSQAETPIVQGLLDDEILQEYQIPVGIISMWSGTIANIPQGWALCNGTLGTPNLSDRFIRATTSQATMNTIGGSDTQTLTIANLPAHNHTGTAASAGAHTHPMSDDRSGSNMSNYNTSTGSNSTGGTAGLSAGTHTHSVSTVNTGSGTAHNNIPAYYALAYIMKL